MRIWNSERKIDMAVYALFVDETRDGGRDFSIESSMLGVYESLEAATEAAQLYHKLVDEALEGFAREYLEDVEKPVYSFFAEYRLLGAPPRPCASAANILRIDV